MDIDNNVVQNEGTAIEFAQSVRKRRVGRARVRQVLADLIAVAVRTDRGLLVIHGMDLRSKWRKLYEETKA
jgi:hypothetical protein